MESSIEAKIVTALADMEDHNMKTVLLLLLGVFKEITGSINSLRADDQGLREAVLNGHSENHAAHHDWIAERIINRCHEVCEWGKGKMVAEQEEDAANRESKRKIRDAVLEKIALVVLSAVLTALGFTLVHMK